MFNVILMRIQRPVKKRDVCCTSLQKEYYEMIDAPDKQFFLYEGCAHSPIYEDGNKTR